MNHTIVGVAHHHTYIALSPQTDVLQNEVADDGSVGIAEKTHVVINVAIIIMIGPDVLDGMALPVEHTPKWMLGGADGYQGIPVLACVAILYEVGRESDGVVGIVVAAVVNSIG